jgi:ribonuclease HII
MMRSALSIRIPLLFPHLDDSKKLSPGERESIYQTIEHLSSRQECQYSFSYREALRIDEIGIRSANKECIYDVILSCLQYLERDDTYEIWIDGCDNFDFDLEDTIVLPAKKKHPLPLTTYEGSRVCRFLIHGDSLHPYISLASNIAKVVRDKMMCEYSEEFPHY